MSLTSLRLTQFIRVIPESGTASGNFCVSNRVLIIFYTTRKPRPVHNMASKKNVNEKNIYRTTDQMSKLNILSLTLLALAGALLASCSSSKQNIVMMSDLEASQQGKLPLSAPELRIQPDDELAINVTAEVPAAAAIYNMPINNNTTRGQLVETINTAGRVQTYRVNKTGDINFPVLGKLHVAGMTTSNLADMLINRISENVENPLVTVELVNFEVKVTGDVKEPGVLKPDKERFTVLDAIAAAGDITVPGRRDNVMVIREENGETTYHRINLTDTKTWTAEYFFLRQNDVVYVEPGPNRKDELTYNERRSFNVSLASIIVSSASVLTSLVIALTK